MMPAAFSALIALNHLMLDLAALVDEVEGHTAVIVHANGCTVDHGASLYFIGRAILWHTGLADCCVRMDKCLIQECKSSSVRYDEQREKI